MADLPSLMIGSLCPGMRTRPRTTDQLVQRGIQGHKRIQKGVIGAHGNSSNPGQCELGA
jgi:hypothetical protein